MKMGLIRFIADRIADQIAAKTSSNWGKLFEMANEAVLWGNKVTQPYKQISNVYKAIKAIADNVPQAELAFYKYDSDDRIYPEPLLRLFDHPNPFMSGADFIQAVVGFFALFGEAFIVKQESIGEKAGLSKLPAELWTFKPTEFTEITELGKLVAWRHQNTRYELSEVIMLRDFNPYHSIRGLAPTDVIAKTIDIDWQALIYNKAFFDNYSQLGLVWSTEQTLSEQQVERELVRLEKRHKGASKAFKSVLATKGLKPMQVSMTPKDMDFIEQKRFSREEMLGIWRVPKAMFSMTEELNYATFMGQMKIFWIYTIEPILRKVESALNRGIIEPYDPNIYCRFDTSGVAAFIEDFSKKVETAEALFRMGFTANEINDKLQLGFEDKPWRDSWWIPFTLAPAGEAGEAAEAAEGKSPTIESKILRPIDGIERRSSEKFFRNHSYHERKMLSALRRFFFEQRKRVLEALFKSDDMAVIKDAGPLRPIDWAAEDQELLMRTMPAIVVAINSGVDFGRELLGEQVSEQLVRQRVNALAREKAMLIVRINTTIKEQIARQLSEAIGEGETIGQMANRVRDVYNMAHARAVMIARTEMTGALNGGHFLYAEIAGAKNKKWLTARDELVRDSHAAIEGQVVPMEQAFGNGLMYPGAPGPPEEVINCRCSWIETK